MKLRQRNNETPVPWGLRAIIVDDAPVQPVLVDSHGCVCSGCGARMRPDDVATVLHHGQGICLAPTEETPCPTPL